MNKRTFIFLYDAKNTIPNGDPMTGEQRIDEDTQKALVSDVRIKRYIRDFLDRDPFNENDIVFYSDSEEKTTSSKRAEKLKKELKIKTLDELKDRCIDVRLFGVVTAEKNDNALTGAVQFMLFNPSINKAKLIATQNTTIMASKEGNTQGSIATYSYLKYGLFTVIGYLNSEIARINNVTEKDLEKMKIALWNEINNKNTRSKNTQNSRLFIEIIYKDDYSKIASIDETIKLKNPDKFYNSFNEIKHKLDFSELFEQINNNKDIIDVIKIYIDTNSFSKDDFKNIKANKKFYTIKGLEIKEI